MIADMPEDKQKISYEDFAKLDIRIGTIITAELVPDTDKPIKCTIDFGLKPSALADGSPLNFPQSEKSGEHSAIADHPPTADGLGEQNIRTIVSGIAEWVLPSDLIGKQFPYVVNLAPRVIRGIESQGMLLAIRTRNGISLLKPDNEVESGSHIS